VEFKYCVRPTCEYITLHVVSQGKCIWTVVSEYCNTACHLW